MEQESFEALLNEEQSTPDKDRGSNFEHKTGKLRKMAHDTVEHTTPTMDPELARARQDNAATEATKEEFAAFSAFVPMVKPDEILSFQRPGIQHHIMRKLRNGDYSEAAFLDLHYLTIEEAYRQTMDFISYARANSYRCVKIVHGKGAQYNPPANMKSHVAHWLKQIPEVLAYHSAPGYGGGPGALMVILKKSEKASEENFELHARRGI